MVAWNCAAGMESSRSDPGSRRTHIDRHKRPCSQFRRSRCKRTRWYSRTENRCLCRAGAYAHRSSRLTTREAAPWGGGHRFRSFRRRIIGVCRSASEKGRQDDRCAQQPFHLTFPGKYESSLTITDNRKTRKQSVSTERDRNRRGPRGHARAIDSRRPPPPLCGAANLLQGAGIELTCLRRSTGERPGTLHRPPMPERDLVEKDDATSLAGIVNWLIGPARRSLLAEQIIQGLAERLVEAGVPLWRVRIGQSVANPLIGAWGAVWVRGGSSTPCRVVCWPRKPITAAHSRMSSVHEPASVIRWRVSLAGRDHAVRSDPVQGQ